MENREPAQSTNQSANQSAKLWRLIPPLRLAGPQQMAIDHWLFDRHAQGTHPPTLRFYTWDPAAISLGYHQQRWPDYWQTLGSIDLVRRPTGGRAVLHQGDLTYAIVTSGLPPQRKAAYAYLCGFLLKGWQVLGFPLHYGQGERGYLHNPNCFATATPADLVLDDGTKFIGSAQLWRGGAVLQHGSMQLAPDPELFEQVFGQGRSGMWVEGLRELAIDRILQELTQAAIHCLGIDLREQPLSEEEWRQIETEQGNWRI